MTHNQAVKTLQDGGPLVDLAEAIGVLGSDPTSALNEIMLGLSYPGFVQEQAAIALHRRLGIPLPVDRKAILMDPGQWVLLTKGRSVHVAAPSPDAENLSGSSDSNCESGVENAAKDALTELLVHGLEARERLLLVLYYFEDMPVREIASLMQLNERAIEDMHRKILRRVSEHLAADVEPLSRLLRDVVAGIAA